MYLNQKATIKKYIQELLEDEQEHGTREIIEYVDSKLKENGIYIFQISSYVNAGLKDLITNDDYAKIAYGMYQKGGIPYIGRTQNEKSDIIKPNFKNTMLAIKSYARKYKEILAAPPPFGGMDSDESRSYQEIKKFLLDKSKNIETNVDAVLRLFYAENYNVRDRAIRKYFKEYLCDGKPHRMNDIKDYIFSKMIENGEYNGERSTAYIHTAIRNLIEDWGEYEKISRGVYQLKGSETKMIENSIYSMDDIAEQLDRGFDFLNSNTKYLLTQELKARGIEDNSLINQLFDDLESSIDGVSFLLAFADDYMYSRENLEQDGIQGMSGM